MLLILTLLAVFLSNTNAFFGFLFGHKNTTIVVMNEPDVNKTFAQLNWKWKKKLTWDAEIAKEALKEAKELYSGKADFVVRKKKWLNSNERNETTMAEKVEGAMVNKFRKAEMFRLHSWL
ncbi:hypothetical protein GCK32_007267 [Trichostrongylus colubriformis]|uniref:Uncharacterized protein n=1 Tax=Trichostrongylus colubriformis TaxID=6319 RepID=A0AAN8GCH0_TRICO